MLKNKSFNIVGYGLLIGVIVGVVIDNVGLGIVLGMLIGFGIKSTKNIMRKKMRIVLHK